MMERPVVSIADASGFVAWFQRVDRARVGLFEALTDHGVHRPYSSLVGAGRLFPLHPQVSKCEFITA